MKFFLRGQNTSSRMAVDGDLLTPRHRPKKRKSRDSLFGWTVFLLVLIGLVFACWIGSFYVFQHPENPRSYKILRKLKKIDPLKRFEPVAAPKGRFYSAEQLWKYYTDKSDSEIARINTELLQAYIGNYNVKESEVPYLMGKFTVLAAKPLQQTDLMTSGFAVLARSLIEPRLYIEQLYPAEERYESDLEQMLTPGVEIKLERTYDLSVVLHVAKWADGRLQITIVPLNYDSYGVGDGRTVHLDPPANLNLAGPLPVIGAKQFDETAVLAGLVATGEKTEAPQTVARSGPTPDRSIIQVARALPIDGKPVAIPKTSPTPEQVGENGMSTPPIVAQSSPGELINPPLEATKAVLVKPATKVIASSAVPTIQPVTPSQWRTYKPGQMPRGRLLDVSDLATLAKNGGPTSMSYLQGNFVVKAITENRAVMRTNDGKTRVVVEFPSNQSAPPTGTKITRGTERPFQITSIKRDRNGDLSVFVREVTVP